MNLALVSNVGMIIYIVSILDIFTSAISRLGTGGKWEQGESRPAAYLIRLLSDLIPVETKDLRKIVSRDGKNFYFNEAAGIIYDSGNSMFYNVPYEQLDKLHLDEIKTHSFIEKEIRLLTYVKDRSAVDLDKVNMDFSIYEKDMYERKIRAPKLKELFEKKLLRLDAFQHGKDIWKRAYPQ